MGDPAAGTCTDVKNGNYLLEDENLEIFCNNVGGIGVTVPEKFNYYYDRTMQYDTTIFLETQTLNLTHANKF